METISVNEAVTAASAADGRCAHVDAPLAMPGRQRSAVREPDRRPRGGCSGQEVERGGNALLANGHACESQAHFDSAQRACERQVVEVAEMTDTKHLSLHLSQPCAERHVETIEDDLAHLVGVMAPGQQ